MNIATFFNGEYESNINEKMMYYAYSFPREDVISYVKDICNISIEDFIAYIITIPSEALEPKDVFQFSNLDNATINLCIELKKIDNPGLKHLEVGKLLLNDGKERNDGAYIKYGENHAKTGAALGLIYELSKTYFLSCIGEVYPDLDENLRQQLLTRLVLRNKLIIRMIKATQNGDVSMRQFLYMLSDSTYVRRSSNIKTICKILESSKEYDFVEITSKMHYS